MSDKVRNYRKKSQATVDLDTLGLEMGNKPPQALDFEEAVLGALLVEPNCLDEAMDELSPSCFYDPRHRVIFETIVSMVNAHNPVDVLTVTERLRAVGKLDEVGGAVTLITMSQKIGAAAQIDYYIRILKQKSIQRDLITASYDILKESYDDSVSVDDLIDTAQTKVFSAIQSNVKKEAQDIGSIIKSALEDVEKRQENVGLSGVPSGYPSLDRITMGWQPSDLIILAARPSVGKTAFALNICRNAAVDHNMPVAFFSLEMSANQLGMRLMTTESGLSADKIKGGVKFAPYEWEQLDYKLKGLMKAPLYVDDTPGLPVTEFRTKVKRLVKSKGVRLVIVDYLQLMQGPKELRAMREQEVAAISRTLKLTAKELNVPIIALSQLSRSAVKREGSTGKPQLSDLRESGSIEQDADMVMFVHRPEYVGMSENIEDREKTQIIIAKHRNGSTADIPMLFKGERIRFIEDNDTLVNEAMSGQYESALNGPSAGPMPSASSDFYPPAQDDFGPNTEFGM